MPSEPPSYDGHREETFGLIHPIAPFYNTLLRVDPTDKSGHQARRRPRRELDGLEGRQTYTFKLRQGVKFHDGSEMTSKDVKASYDKIIFPPPGVGSTRKGQYADVEVGRGARPVHGRVPPEVALGLVPARRWLSPYNFIYKADILAKDMHWYEKNIMGTGPFMFVEHVKGSHVVGKKNPELLGQGQALPRRLPRDLHQLDSAAQVAAVRGERAHIQFRGFTPGRARQPRTGASATRSRCRRAPGTAS